MLILSVTFADVPKVQVAGNNDELKEVRDKISKLEKKIETIEANMSANPSDLKLRLLLAAEDQLTELRKKENILLQSQQPQQGDLT